MSTGSGGFGVEAGQLRQVARQYDGEGADLLAIADTVVTGVGEGQVGRRYGAVAAPYRRAFDQFTRNLASFGAEAAAISMRLNEIAGAYESTEDTNASSTGTVG